MAKLSSARDFRTYGPQTSRNRWEYVNAGIYIAAAVLLLAGFVAQIYPAGIDGRSCHAVIIIGLILMAIVSAHDLIAHLIGIDFSISLIEFDIQLAVVEISVPLWLILGDALTAFGFVLLLIQRGREKYDWILERHAGDLLIVGPMFWMLGSVQNSSQVYERFNGPLQLLQQRVQILFLMGSLLFTVGGIFNTNEIFGQYRKYHSFDLVSERWVWLSLFGSLFFLIGGLINVFKVSEMHRMDRVTLERLRGGALERLMYERVGRVPLILEGRSRRRQHAEGTMPTSTAPVPAQTSAGGASGGGGTSRAYKDVLVSGGGGVSGV